MPMKPLLWIALLLAVAAAWAQPHALEPVLATPSQAANEQVAPGTEVIVSAPQPRYVAPTQRDRIGRIWAPVSDEP